MAETKRIAQTTLTCSVCQKPILTGHPYIWEQEKRDGIIMLKKCHPECQKG